MTKPEITQEILSRVKQSETNQVIKLPVEAFSKGISITGLAVQRLLGLAKFYRFYPLSTLSSTFLVLESMKVFNELEFEILEKKELPHQENINPVLFQTKTNFTKS